MGGGGEAGQEEQPGMARGRDLNNPCTVDGALSVDSALYLTHRKGAGVLYSCYIHTGTARP